MSNKKQTAVEWLELSLLGIISFDSEELRLKYKDKLAKAKELEKQQIIDACDYGKECLFKGKYLKSETYYTETYEK